MDMSSVLLNIFSLNFNTLATICIIAKIICKRMCVFIHSNEQVPSPAANMRSCFYMPHNVK